MAINNNLQQVSLGAPPSISISANQYPHAAVAVQTMERCDTLTLHDAADGTRCTEEGAMVTAARLLTQLMHERSISENAEGWSITYDVYAMVDAAVYGGAEHPVQMSLTGADGAAAVCWAVEGDATPGVSLTADGVLTLPAGCTDTLRIKAIRWDDREVRAMTTIPVSGWREVADLLVQYPSLAAVLAEYPSLAAVLAERPALCEVVAEWPSVVNSLVETGKRNWIQGDGNAYINTNISISQCSKFSVETSIKSGNLGIIGTTDSYGGVYMWGSTMWISGSINMGNISETDYIEITYDNGSIKAGSLSGTSKYTSANPLLIGKVGSVGNYTGRYYSAKIESTAATLELVPFIRNNQVGLLDLLSNTFYENAGSGQFTLTTDPK